jgi:hypothetical protein
MRKAQSLQLAVGNYSRLVFLSVTCGLWSVVSFAQDSTMVNGNKNFTIKQETAIANLLYKYKEYNRKREFGEGFRIQITYTDVRDEVYKSKGALYKEFPDLSSYVEYEQPSYKLRVGDFKSRLEATRYLQLVVTLYPGAFIVRDKIKIK